MGSAVRRAIRAFSVVGLLVSTVATLHPSPASADDVSYSATVVADGAIGYWRLGEPAGATTAADASAHSRQGTYLGPVQLGIPGPPGTTDTAASFDGSGATKVSIADDATVRLNGSFSIEFWANQNSFVNTWPSLLAQGSGTTAGGYLIYAKPDGRLSFKRNNTEFVTSAGALATGQWHHYAITYDGTNVRWFVDGVANTSAQRSYPSSALAAPLVLGNGDQGGNNRLDEVAMYASALSAVQLKNHVRLGGHAPTPYSTAVVSDGALGYWRLGETSTSNAAVDSSAHGRKGAYSGTITVGVAGAQASWSDTAASFNGSKTSKVSIPDDSALRLNGPFSIEFWASQNTFTNSKPAILAKGSGTATGGYQIYAKSDGRLTFKRNNTELDTTTGALVTGQWHHYVVTYDGTTLRWFRDGAANTSVARSFLSSALTSPLVLGNGDQGGNNRLDEVALYGAALSSQQVAYHYNLTAPPPPPAYASTVLADGPAAYWRLGDASASAVDASGNGHGGTYTGGYSHVAGALVGTSDSATSFDGISGGVTVPDAGPLRLNGAWSMEFWGNQNSFANSWPGILEKGDPSGPDGYLIYVTSTGALSYKRWNNEMRTTANVFVTGQWHHYAITYDGGSVRWYVDGALNSTTSEFYFGDAGSAPLQIGRGDTPGNNRLDEVAIYTTTLTPAQIANHYATGRATQTTVPPGAPTAPTTAVGNASVGLRWSAPASDGGTKITKYRVTVNPGGTTLDVPGWSLAAQPAGLTNGVAYTFTVAAINGAGIGPPSSPSAPVTPSAGTPAAVRDTTPGGWPGYTYDLQGSGHNNAETTISPATAPALAEKWRANAGGMVLGQVSAGFGGLFVSDNDGYVHRFALDGTPVWATYVGYDSGPCTSQGPVSSATLATLGARHVLYIGGGDSSLYAIDADTGQVIWQNFIDDVANGGFAWTSPMLVNNVLYMGTASLGDCPLTPGLMVKVDPATGRTLARTALAPDGCVGGGIWGSPTFADNTVFITTGTEDRCVAPNTLEISMLALDGDTLAVKSFWHIPEDQQTDDGDFGSVPTVFDASIPGTSGHFIAAANKNGVFYAFDRTNVAAGPVWQTQIAVGGACPTCGEGAISPATYDGTFLYVAAGNTTTVGGSPCTTAMRAIRPSDGSIVWEDCRNGALDGPVIGPVSSANGVVVYDEGHYIAVVSAATGARLLTYQTGLPNHSSVMYAGPSISNGVIYAGGADGWLYALGLP